jgi:hypothetical protein
MAGHRRHRHYNPVVQSSELNGLNANEERVDRPASTKIAANVMLCRHSKPAPLIRRAALLEHGIAGGHPLRDLRRMIALPGFFPNDPGFKKHGHLPLAVLPSRRIASPFPVLALGDANSRGATPHWACNTGNRLRRASPPGARRHRGRKAALNQSARHGYDAS